MGGRRSTSFVREEALGLLLALWFAGALCAPAMAQPDDPCEDPSLLPQLEMNICLERFYQAADVELNRIWPEARATAKVFDADTPLGFEKGADAALLVSQRAWLAYRDSQCALAGFEARPGSSLHGMLLWTCMWELTDQRTKQLNEFIDSHH